MTQPKGEYKAGENIQWRPCEVALRDLIPWERNPKTISKSHARRLLDLWKRIGQFQTIAIGPAGEVYDGHQRLSVLKAAFGDGYNVQALRAPAALTEEQRQELTIAAHTGTVGQFDWDQLANWDAGSLQEWGMDGETLRDWKADASALFQMLAGDGVISEADAFGALPTQDRAPFRQMTFTLHDTQAEQVERALKISKSMGAFVDSENENSNGNALARICETFVSEHGDG